MNVTKVINNNIVISENEEKQELVVMGKGLGFKKKPGDVIDDTKIEKVYLSTQEWNVTKLTQLLSSIPIEHIQAANEIISFAKVSLGKKLSEKLFLTLTDHINYAIERYQNGMEIKNALLWEIKRFITMNTSLAKKRYRSLKIAWRSSCQKMKPASLHCTSLMRSWIWRRSVKYRKWRRSFSIS